MSLVLFYGNQVYATYIARNELRKDLFPHTSVQADVYNGGYVYATNEREWYRCDFTPVLIEDVPKVLQMLQLVLKL